MALMKWMLTLVILTGWCPRSDAAVLFEESEVIEVQLTGPLHSIFEDKEQRQEQPFLLSVDGATILVRARIRGKSRARICNFPPLRLNFTGSDTRQSVFEGQEELKLVTHCRGNSSGSMNVLEEYAAYRIFNLLTDTSYRARLLHITYEDTGHDLDANEKRNYGFLIEPKEQLQERIGGEWVQLPGVKMSRVEEDHAALVFVFEYLIGNTDWSLLLADGDDACCHNGDLLEIDSELYYVPYDFDLAGLVNASYAKPDPSLHLKNDRKRRYRGYCIDSAPLERAIRLIKSKEADILGLLQELPEYPEKTAGKNLEYFEKFFESADNEAKLLKKFERGCLD